MAVYWCGPGVEGMLSFLGYRMVKFGLRSVDKTLHAEVDIGWRCCVLPV